MTVVPHTAEPACAFSIAGQSFTAPRAAAGLYLVATPIGNLRDITLRALEILAGADVIACEDTRVTRHLLTHYGIATALTPYHEHNAAAARPALLARLAEGEAIAVVSDAGTPLVSDPGFKLVRDALAQGYPVTAIPGASAPLTALAVAGLPTDAFFFAGFLPSRSAARQTRLKELATVPGTLLFFESGARLAECIADLFAVLGAREAAICRELTKLHETVTRGRLDVLMQSEALAETRGEFVLAVAPPTEAAASEDELRALLSAALQRASVKDAVADVTAATGAARRDVYRLALTMQDEVPRER